MDRRTTRPRLPLVTPCRLRFHRHRTTSGEPCCTCNYFICPICTTPSLSLVYYRSRPLSRCQCRLESLHSTQGNHDDDADMDLGARRLVGTTTSYAYYEHQAMAAMPLTIFPRQPGLQNAGPLNHCQNIFCPFTCLSANVQLSMNNTMPRSSLPTG